MRVLFRYLIAALAMAPLPALAEEQRQTSCSGPAATPWTGSAPLTAGGEPEHLPAMLVARPAEVKLLPTPQVRFAPPSEKPGDPASYGGLLGVEVAQAGTYRVALSAGAWIDLVRDGRTVASTAHAHGAPCSGIAKMVDFPLTAGRYTLELSSSASAGIRVLVTRTSS